MRRKRIQIDIPVRGMPAEGAKRVAIIGYNSTKKLAPWADRTVDRWGFNEPGKENPMRYGFSEWFQLHQRHYLERGQRNQAALGFFTWSVDWYASLRYTPLTVWDPTDWPECPTVQRYPKEAVEALTLHGRYHLSSVDWLVALAIQRGYKHISIYGIDFGPTDGGEPMGARACLEYWLGVAEGRGIETHVEGGAMFTGYQWVRSSWQYGYEHANNEIHKLGPVPD